MRKASHLPDHMFVLIEGVRRRLAHDLAGSPIDDGIRRSYRRLLQMVPDDGIRMTDFAALAGMTKQALGEFVDGMQAEGLLVTERLATDRRVRLVRRTSKGDSVSRTTSAAVAAVEDRWRTEVGADRYDTMKAVLAEIGADSFELP